MQVFVRTCEGKTITADVSPGDDVESVREYLNNCNTGARLLFGGYHLEQGKCLESYGISDGSTLFEVSCLYGGGCDGGTTALQRKFMSQASTKKHDEARDASDEQRAKWEMCAASGSPLYDPVVCCELGYLFNKEAILQQMATKTTHANFKHIRRLKDLLTLKLHPNPEFDANKGSKTTLDWASAPSKYVCPITTKPANGKCHFIAIKTCGHVISEQALRELGTGGKCPVCFSKFARKTDIVPLNPNPEVLAERRQELESRRAAESESKKRSRGGEEAGEVASEEKSAAAKAPRNSAASSAPTAAAAAAAQGIHFSLSGSVAKSATLGVAAHSRKAHTDPVYASMFKRGGKDYDAVWGQGAMAGVLGGR